MSPEAVDEGREAFTLRVNDDREATVRLNANARERELLVAGGKLPHARGQLAQSRTVSGTAPRRGR